MKHIVLLGAIDGVDKHGRGLHREHHAGVGQKGPPRGRCLEAGDFERRGRGLVDQEPWRGEAWGRHAEVHDNAVESRFSAELFRALLP